MLISIFCNYIILKTIQNKLDNFKNVFITYIAKLFQRTQEQDYQITLTVD